LSGTRQRRVLIQVNRNGFAARNFELQCSSISRLEGLEIGEDIRNLVRIQPELGHGRMVCDDPLSQWPLQAFDGKSLMQCAKRGRKGGLSKA
jgi:hypothetical protein